MSALSSSEKTGPAHNMASAAETCGSAASSSMPLDTGYSYQQFLERLKHHSAQVVVNDIRDLVNQFPANLTRPQAAKRIHSFLSQVTPRLLAVEAFSSPDLADTAQELAGEGLEKFVLLKLYKLLFRHSPSDLREDDRVDTVIETSRSAGAKSQHASLLNAMAQLEQTHRGVFSAAASELHKVDQYRAPRDKLNCFVNAFCLLEGIVVERVKDGNHGSNSAFLQTLVAAMIVESAPPNLYSNIEFAAVFRYPGRRKRDEQKCLAEIASAINLVVGGGLQFAPELQDAKEGLPSTTMDLTSSAVAAEDLPLWLVDAGVTFHFENKSVDELLLGELDELLDEYQNMSRALHELVMQPHREDCN